MIPVNPDILVWARETAGLTLQEAATKINIVKRSLERIEKGEKAPSHAMLHRMAEKYRRPLLTFYLENIPSEANYGADFRGLSEQIAPKDKALIAALLRYAKASQEMIRAELELEEECVSLPFVGWLRRKWNLPTDVEFLERELQQMTRAKYKLLVQDGLRGLNLVLSDRCTREKYYEQPDPSSAFKLLRSSCENSGIFVVLKSNLGSSQSRLSPNLFRAFVIADDIAPFMVINKEDSVPARAFSVLHEIIHLLLDQTGISNLERVNQIEKFCNHVAGEWLLPMELIKHEEIGSQQDVSKIKEVIDRVSHQRNLSHTMVALRLFQEKVISQELFSHLQSYYKKEWEKTQQSKKGRQKGKKEGGPDYYVVRRSELGNALIQFTKRMIQSENLTVSKAATILSVKSGQVYKLLNPSTKKSNSSVAVSP